MSSDDPRVGAIFLDRLKVIRHIGGGGMGAVYEVEHLRTGHLRALKIVRPEYSAQPRYMKRLLREARVAATLNTPHVAETLDAGVLEDGSAYVLMELLHGRPLISLLEERPRLEPEEVVWIASEICQGLAVAHAADIVHRDLKPENIFLVPSGDDGALVKILDFGISQFPASLAEAPNRLTREGTILGTPFYMSPEQAAGRTMDARTDLYALGVVMYEALSGSLPFDSPTIGELFLRIAAGEYMPLEQRTPELDPNLVAVVARAMHRDPAQRYTSAVALREALVPFLGVGPAAPGRVTLRLNALAQPPKPRVETLDYSSSPPSERETMAPPESEPPMGELNLTPAHASPIVSSRDSSPRPVRRSSESMDSLEASMAVASTPPAGMPTYNTPGSIPPPSSIPQALTPATSSEPVAAHAPLWRQPLLLAVAVAVVAFSLSLWWGAVRTPQASAPDPRPAPTSATEAATAAERAPRAPAEQVTESAAQVPSAEQVEVSDAGAVAVDPRPHGLRPHSGMNHGKSRPSHAAGLDQNPY